MFASDLRKLARAVARPWCPWILCGAILGRTAAASLIFINHRQVSFYYSFHLSKPRKYNTPLLLFPDFFARFLDQVLRFLYGSVRNPPLAIFAIFQARRMSDCSSCTRPPCLAIVADMLKSCRILDAASEGENQRLPLPHTLP